MIICWAGFLPMVTVTFSSCEPPFLGTLMPTVVSVFSEAVFFVLYSLTLLPSGFKLDDCVA